jgi:hypothetical protein
LVDSHRDFVPDAFPHNYWFAKHQFDSALEVVAKCGKHLTGNEQDRAALSESQRGGKNLLRDRTVAYQYWWKTVRGRDPEPDEEEWYEIEEARQIAAAKGEMYQAASTGGPYTQSDWLFPDLNGECFHRRSLSCVVRVG